MTAVFGILDALQHPATGIRDAGQVWTIELVTLSGREGPDASEWEQVIRRLPGVAEATTLRSLPAEVVVADEASRRTVGYARAGFWELLGIRPRLGRLPGRADRPSQSAAVVSDSLWRSHFGNLRAIDSASLTIDGTTYPISGVLPRNSSVPPYVDVWLPDARPTVRGIAVVRLNEGASPAQLTRDLHAAVRRFDNLYLSPTDRPFSTVVRSMLPDPMALKDFHKAMLGAALCILLIACANVASLMLARGIARARYYAVKKALGATAAAIVGEVAVEIVVLGVLGCLAGSVLAAWALQVLSVSTPVQMTRLGFVEPQWSVRVVVQGAIALVTSLAIAGGLPAWRAAHVDPVGPLKEGGGGHTGRLSRAFGVIMVAATAVAMAVLVGAALMTKSARQIERYDFGYDARSLLQAKFWPWTSPMRHNATEGDESSRIIDRIRPLAQVSSAALVRECQAEKGVAVSDRISQGGASLYLPSGNCWNVSDGFFQTLGVRIADGRDFSSADASSGGAAILDRKAARQLFGTESPIGHRIKLGSEQSNAPWLRIVGLVEDQHLAFNAHPELAAEQVGVIYVCTALHSGESGSVLIRPRPGASDAATAVRRALVAILPPQSFVRTQRWTAEYDQGVREEQFLALVFSLFGTVATALVAMGLFSVVTYIVGQRAHEYAVRTALGATGAKIAFAVLREAMTVVLAGTAVGSGVGMWSSFLLWDKMWGVYPVDVGALIVAQAVMVATTFVACQVPAIRAAHTDPNLALHVG